MASALHLRKKHGKTSVRVVEKCPDIPVAFICANVSVREEQFVCWQEAWLRFQGLLKCVAVSVGFSGALTL
jgi:hypothetical protein